MEGAKDIAENPPSENNNVSPPSSASSTTQDAIAMIKIPENNDESSLETHYNAKVPSSNDVALVDQNASDIKIIARPSPPDDEYIPSSVSASSTSSSSPMKRNGSVVPKDPSNTSSPRSSERAKMSSNYNFDKSKVQIDTTAPIESVKAAVSKFGGIVDWKAHRQQTMERRKLMEQELEKAQEEIPSYKKQSEEAEAAKSHVLKELDSTKRLIEELKINLERAQKEEEQAKQDSELAKLRVEELEQGIAEEASFAAKAQVEVARARHVAAVSELKSVKQELEQLKKNYALLVSERDESVKKAEEAVSALKEVEKSVEDLTIELITAKESLESAHAAHMEAEEHRIGAVMAKEQDVLQWEKELKEAEEELEKLTQQMMMSKDLKEKLDKATALLEGLKSEMGAYMESKINEEFNGEKQKTHADIELAYSKAKKELEEMKIKIDKATEEVNILKVASLSLKFELEKEKSELSAIQQREGMASIAVSSLEAELDRTKSEIALVKTKEKEEKEKMVELPKQLQEVAQEADRVKALCQEAKENLRKAEEEAEQAKAGANTVESRLHAVLKEIEAAKASEKLALAAINALKESESAQKENDDDESSSGVVTLSLEEYYELSKRAHEAEEQANMRVANALSQVEVAKKSELKSLNKLEEAQREIAQGREALDSALQKAEKAKEGKLGAEQQLRNWRAENEQRRKAGNELVNQENRSSKVSFEDGSEAKKSISTPDSSILYEKSSPNSSNLGIEDSPLVRVVTKKKKRSFFLRIFMSLARKKSQANNKSV